MFISRENYADTIENSDYESVVSSVHESSKKTEEPAQLLEIQQTAAPATSPVLMPPPTSTPPSHQQIKSNAQIEQGYTVPVQPKPKQFSKGSIEGNNSNLISNKKKSLMTDKTVLCSVPPKDIRCYVTNN